MRALLSQCPTSAVSRYEPILVKADLHRRYFVFDTLAMPRKTRFGRTAGWPESSGSNIDEEFW